MTQDTRAELDALLERQLVMLEHCAEGARRAYLPGKGRTFLDALHPGAAASCLMAGNPGVRDD
jgi:hypothetical protein